MNLPLIVSPQVLSTSAPANVKYVDVRTLDDYTVGHLPGAVQLNLSMLNRSEKAESGLLPDQDGVKSLAESIGLRADDHIVAYDQGGASAAARLVWVLHAYGFNQISWLNGGFPAWERAKLPISVDVVAPAESNLQLQFCAGNMVSVEELIEQLNDADLRVLDVRSAGEFDGSDIRAARGGHVPKAVHSEWTNAFNELGELKSDDQLRSLYTALDVTPNQKVLVYCQTHQRSALTYVVLKHLDYERVIALDGAWSAWGNRHDTPIEDETE